MLQFGLHGLGDAEMGISSTPPPLFKAPRQEHKWMPATHLQCHQGVAKVVPINDEASMAQAGNDCANGEDRDSWGNLQQDNVGGWEPQQHAEEECEELPQSLANHSQCTRQVADDGWSVCWLVMVCTRVAGGTHVSGR